jgi:DNA-binding response OmpR family regulator
MIAHLEAPLRFRPRVVLACDSSARLALIGRHFRRHGWETRHAADGAEARRLALLLAPDLVVLDADLPGESGWLTCAKLHLQRPDQKIVLISAECSEEKRQLSVFVGAAALVQREGPPLILAGEFLNSALLSAS